jgi:hypothetical protein
MESRCYDDSMSSETTPEAALDAARAARRAAAAAVGIPPRFPALAGLSCALGFGLLGVSALVHDSERTAFAAAGLLLCAINIAAFTLLARHWVRAGVLPRPGAAARSRRQRWTSTNIDLAAFAISGLIWLVTDHIGWAAITLGVLLGTSTWRRLSLEARKTR